jgi:hypothetical protein
VDRDGNRLVVLHYAVKGNIRSWSANIVRFLSNKYPGAISKPNKEGELPSHQHQDFLSEINAFTLRAAHDGRTA